MSVKIGRNDPCWCKSGRKYKACHQAFDEKIAAIAAQGHIVPTHDIIKNADQIAGIKESCKINIAVLMYLLIFHLFLHITHLLSSKRASATSAAVTAIGKYLRAILFAAVV